MWSWEAIPSPSITATILCTYKCIFPEASPGILHSFQSLSSWHQQQAPTERITSRCLWGKPQWVEKSLLCVESIWKQSLFLSKQFLFAKVMLCFKWCVCFWPWGGHILMAHKSTVLQCINVFNEKNSRDLPLPPDPNTNSLALCSAYLFSLIYCCLPSCCWVGGRENAADTQDHPQLWNAPPLWNLPRLSYPTLHASSHTLIKQN